MPHRIEINAIAFAIQPVLMKGEVKFAGDATSAFSHI
jgi:hypothetical protein